MSPMYIWLTAYAVPALIAGTLVKVLPRNKGSLDTRNAVIMHVALIVSVCLSQYFIYASGLTFPWYPNVLSVAAYFLSVLIAIALIGQIGFWYGLSAFIQQLSMLSIAFLLLPSYPLYAIALLIVPLYAWCHALEVRNWTTRISLFLIWGTASILIFSILFNVYIIAALHTLFGAWLISRSLLYPAE